MSTSEPVATPATAEQKKTRVQMIDVLDIFVPPPRVRNYFSKKLVEVEKHFELKQLKKKEDASSATSTASSSATQSDESSSRTGVTQDIRLSPEANAALSIVSSSLLVDVIKHAMNNALTANMKRVTVAHFLLQKLETLDSQSLVEHLPSVKHRLATMATQPAAPTKSKKAAAPAQPAEATQQAVEVAQLPADATASTESATQSADVDASKKDPEFITYVARAFADVKAKDTRYADLMLTNDFKVFLSAVLVEFVQSVATLSMVFIEAMDLKTIKHRVVMKVVKSMLVLHSRFDVFTTYRNTVEEKLKLYESYENDGKDTVELTDKPAA